jgi:hypothetical protein
MKLAIDLWKQAYRYEFGHAPEADLPEFAAEVAAWREDWENGYAAGDIWAWRLLQHTDDLDRLPESA